MKLGQLCVEMPTVMDPFTAVEDKNECKLNLFGICINWRVQEEMDDECNLKINEQCVWQKDPAVREGCHLKIPIVGIFVIPAVQDEQGRNCLPLPFVHGPEHCIPCTPSNILGKPCLPGVKDLFPAIWEDTKKDPFPALIEE